MLTDLIEEIPMCGQLHQHIQSWYVIPMPMLHHQGIHVFQDILALQRFVYRDLFLQRLEVDGWFSIM